MKMSKRIVRPIVIGALAAFAALTATAAPPPPTRAAEAAQVSPKVTVIIGVKSDPVRAYAESTSTAATMIAAKDLQLPYVTSKWKNFRYAVTVGASEYWLRSADVKTRATECRVFARSAEAAQGVNGARGFGEACGSR